MATDEFLLSSEPYATKDAWCRDRLAHTRKRLEDLDWMTPTVLVNHFPLVREPCDALFYPEFSLWCGTTATADWHTRYNADLLGVRPPAHPAHHLVRRRALRGGVGRLPAGVAAPQAVSLAAAGAARPEVRAGLPQRVRRSLRDHAGDARRSAQKIQDRIATGRRRGEMMSRRCSPTRCCPRRRGAAAAEMYTDPPELAPLPEEEPLIAKSVAKRRNEFITVRYCARLALAELGCRPCRSSRGRRANRAGPTAWSAASPTARATAARRSAAHGAVRSVGIDAEPHDVLPKGVLDAISLPAERSEISALPDGLHWDRILFCAKEATYKAWFPADPALAGVRGRAHHLRRRRRR